MTSGAQMPKFDAMAQKENSVSRLQHNFLLNPITALTTYQDASGCVLALAGEDAWLKVYDVDSNQLLGQLRVFHSQSIHGIYVSQGDGQKASILIWGGQSVVILPQTALQTLSEGGTPPAPVELKAPDWIYDGILFSSSSGVSGALVTAHNEIVPILASPDGTSFSFGGLTSPSRPILYSANLSLLSPSTILVAGGTVFGEIIVWKYHLDSTLPSQWEVLFVFTGHEGSIFGVSISPEIEIAPDTKLRLLASCSDDRTVRVWDITDRASGVIAPRVSVSQEARETGFGENSEARSENRNDSSKCVAVEMGHVSRIWHVKFTGQTDYQEKPIEVYSFGEDGSRQKWELSLDTAQWKEAARPRLEEDAEPWVQPAGKLRNCDGMVCHSGKNIWAATVSRQEQSLLIMSGGADGKIAVSQGGEFLKDERNLVGDISSVGLSDVNTRLTFDEFLQFVTPLKDGVVPPATKAFGRQSFYRYVFLSENTLLVTAASGRLFVGTFGSPTVWEELAVPEAISADIASFHMLESPREGTAVIGTLSGKLYLLDEAREITEIAQLPAKITDIICPGHSGCKSAKEDTTQTLFITVIGQGHATMLEYDTSTGKTLGDFTAIKFDNDYQNYVMTAASYCGSHLIFGSRVGTLTLYEYADGSWTKIEARKDCKDKDAVTSIVPLPGSSTAFLTTCRDGRHRIYAIDSQNGRATLHLQHEISPPIGMIEGAEFSDHSGTWELILHGFRGKYFVVWNETLRQELAAVECGGANRPYSYKCSPSDPAKLMFVYTKVTQMGFYAQKHPALRTLKEGAHGREIRTVAASDNGYVATAAEDTTIRIWQYKDSVNPTPRAFRCLAVMEKHSAGIQALKWCGNNYLLSSAGNEELFIWHITRVDSEYEVLAVVCEAVYPDRTVDGDLRIMNLDVQSWSGNGKEMLISLVLSNSTLRTYRYSKDLGFLLLSTRHYTGACLTQIYHLHTTADELHVLTAATDGYLCIWSSVRKPNTDDYTPYALITATKLHQSTIKSMDISSSPCSDSSQSPTRRWLAVTGGDDNALGFLDILFTPSFSSFTIQLNKSRIKSAHAAAVTGLTVLPSCDAQGEATEVATVSNDQRVKVWRVIRGDGMERLRVQMRENWYSSVADAGDVEVIGEQRRRLMIGGVGVEVWEV
ncbi:WD40-repeat-containing domain protein [Cercophora newfieldiana]|uniref:WD40-repeat-containing domain protein n=1 Tax=Cercophora newfieldiana TaxID=92897 RepID=A0AA40D235_9PEZI|nr:WD40-repeat-containing domain protein [Cercophora newfieldiana]